MANTSYENHCAYFRQFVTQSIEGYVVSAIGGENILNASDEKCLNDIPLTRWDALARSIRMMVDGEKMRELGEQFSLASMVCIAKEAARMYRAKHKDDQHGT